MGKSLGTVVQFERSLTYAKFISARYLHCTYPPFSPHPTDSVETVKAEFLWSFDIVLGGEGEGVMDFLNESTSF